MNGDNGTPKFYNISRFNISDGMYEAVANFLETDGFCCSGRSSETRSDEESSPMPDLFTVFFDLRKELKNESIQTATDRLKIYTQTFPGRVLCLDPRLPESLDIVEHDHVIFFGNRSKDEFKALRKALKDPLNSDSFPARLIPLDKLVYVVLSNLFGNHLLNEQFNEKNLPLLMRQVVDFAIERFKLTACKVTCDISMLEFVHMLHLVSSRYNVLEHDLNAQGRNWFDSQRPDNANSVPLASESSVQASDVTRLNIARMRALLHTAEDTISSLLMANEIVTPPKILVVDDAPSRIMPEIKAVLDVFLPMNYTLSHWNPVEHGTLWIDRLTNYNSLNNVENWKEKITIVHWFDDPCHERNAPNLITIESALNDFDVVFVDLLYRVKDQDLSVGAELVRGMRRLSIDTHGHAPRFLMLSRADDTAKVQRALRAGAAGYVFKNRLLSLPAELARLQAGPSREGASLHRNFLALESLPNEIKGLLHKVCIPPIRFDRPSLATHQTDGKPDWHDIAKLLRAIPKPDLHLHVGSCMTPEFLIVASILMLAERYKNLPSTLLEAVVALFHFWLGKGRLRFDQSMGCLANHALTFPSLQEPPASTDGHDSVCLFGAQLRRLLREAIEADATKQLSQRSERSLRSVLHDKLGIPDYWNMAKACDALDTIDPVTLMLFAVAMARIQWGDNCEWSCGNTFSNDDLIRIFILFLASQYNRQRPSPEITITIMGQEFYKPLRKLVEAILEPASLKEPLQQLDINFAFLNNKVIVSDPELPDRVTFNVLLGIDHSDLVRACPDYAQSPLEYMVATGPRARNLAEYLAGCEYAGALHLRRRGLLRLYARQTLEYLVRHGILYAELRAAVSGYASKGKGGMNYREACSYFQEAFQIEQTSMIKAYSEVVAGVNSACSNAPEPRGWMWCQGVDGNEVWKQVFQRVRSDSPFERFFPAKVNLIFTGKRHKATRIMVMESSAGVMMNVESVSKLISSSEFSKENMVQCRVVGFDLAGLEEGFPPEMFRPYFEQLSRMHIPVTAHAGENASVSFVESAVLDLRARRLGHGIALAEDEKLMSRVRDERICIELCPVSNYQTNEFSVSKPGRIYPLRKFFDNGNVVCLNTDNPIVSHTNIVKEFFQASYAWADNDAAGKLNWKSGLSLWDALRLIRMGFAHSFMGLAERRAMIELVEQMIMDLLMSPTVIKTLQRLALKDNKLNVGGAISNAK